VVNLALIEQAHCGPYSIKCENHLIFCHQLEKTRACCTANTEHKEAYKRSLAAYLKVPFTNCYVPAMSILATLITSKPISIDFKKIQGKDCIKVFQLKIKATIK
jgi:hypothetical protein